MRQKSTARDVKGDTVQDVAFGSVRGEAQPGVEQKTEREMQNLGEKAQKRKGRVG